MIRLILLGALLLLAGGQARSDAQPVVQQGTPSRRLGDAPVLEVTTDSRAYCRTLSRQIETYRNLSREVRDLQAEGGMLCDQGQVRGGINRLRRALMAIRSGQEVTPIPP